MKARSILTLNQRRVLAQLIDKGDTADLHDLPDMNRIGVTIDSLVQRGLIKRVRDSWGVALFITDEGREIMQ